jgi:hypothetical protein
MFLSWSTSETWADGDGDGAMIGFVGLGIASVICQEYGFRSLFVPR